MGNVLFHILTTFALIAYLLPTCFGQDKECLKFYLAKGDEYYQQADYVNAVKYWEKGKKCTYTHLETFDARIEKTKDTDKDGVINGKDNCPYIAGKTKSGCPIILPKDTDRDGVPDTTDQCPDRPGSVKLNGCPPTPKDTINVQENLVGIKSSSIGRYMVIAGSFKEIAPAKMELRKIQQLGYSSARIEKFNRGAYASVLVGRFDRASDAKMLVKTLKDKGFDAIVLEKM